jgi:hypothetical protein
MKRSASTSPAGSNAQALCDPQIHRPTDNQHCRYENTCCSVLFGWFFVVAVFLFVVCLAPRPPSLAQVVARPFSQWLPATGGLPINANWCLNQLASFSLADCIFMRKQLSSGTPGDLKMQTRHGAIVSVRDGDH